MKLVRNGQPGNAIDIQYVRGGKQATTQVKLTEEGAKETSYMKWPKWDTTFRLPWSPLKPGFWSEAKDLNHD